MIRRILNRVTTRSLFQHESKKSNAMFRDLLHLINQEFKKNREISKIRGQIKVKNQEKRLKK